MNRESTREGHKSRIKKVFLGDSCLTWSWAETISLETSHRVLRAYRCFKDNAELKRLGVLDTVPAYCSLAIYFDPLEADLERLQIKAERLIARLVDEPEIPEVAASGERVFRLSVVYDGEDLERVASHARLTVRDVIALHTRPKYTVAMIGFLPHYPYLIGLDEQLTTPRLESPRQKVPAGSVAIGGSQTGIYPSESPGGWNLIGRTDPKSLEELLPGDSVFFEEA
jgi:KipI family sensor histidine kinase inhibitor